ncbi:MAG: DUF4445 domain-containing protein [Candidatus Omnitrophica bacterium]|nr:DUF4445 domain-containing protein [Candidatus Omnitrophota bacterium]
MKKIGNKRLGIALDIGTTEVKGALVDLETARDMSTSGAPNEQKAFGQDIITRLGLAMEAKGRRLLNKKVADTIDNLIKKLLNDTGCSQDAVKEIVAVGNSAMYHLLLMIKPDDLARAPFKPSESSLKEKRAEDVGIGIAKGARFRFLPNMGGFVGSDALGSILATRIHKKKNYSVIMDVGTNGELVLGSKEKIFVASCASGPAFEGRHISCGMPAIDGAITGSRIISNRMRFATVGDTEPRGVSGSGLIDVVSILVDKGIIGRDGRMKKKRFDLYEGSGKNIYITQEDIRQIQLAKAAFASGLEIMRRKANIEWNQLDTFYITGAFGRGIDKKNAKNISLIPRELNPNKILFLKEGALSGAKAFLLHSGQLTEEIDEILSICAHIELHKERDFQDIYADATRF